MIPEWHLTLIQYHSWLIVSSLVLVLTEMLLRDAEAILLWEHIEKSDNLVPETIAFVLLALWNILHLFLTPKIFGSFV